MITPRNKQHIDPRFLEGPRSRWKEFVSVISIAREFIGLSSSTTKITTP